MKIKYLGTAAYEGVPAMFCQCDVCKRARALGGKNIRSRSQALVNDEILLDFNADTNAHYLKYNFDWQKIEGILITHSHCDHLYPEDLEMLEKGYTHGVRPMHFYVGESGYRAMQKNADFCGDRMVRSLVKPGQRFSVGKYQVLALPANHAANTSPVFYSIYHEGKRMLYAHDTGVFFDSAWELLKIEGYFNFVSLDCTGCMGNEWDWRNGHMSVKTNLEVLAKMREMGLVDDKTIVVINHFSHNGGQNYSEMVEECARLGLQVSYDGMEIEF